MAYNRGRPDLLFEAILLGILALNPSFISAQPSTPQTTNDDGQRSHEPGGGQICTTSKAGSDDRSEEKSKDQEPPPAYKLLRYEEDYSYLKDYSHRTDFWDPIKYIPLWDRDDWYLSTGGFLRERYEFYRNQDAGAVPPDARNNGYLLARYLLHGAASVIQSADFVDVRRGLGATGTR